MDLSCIILSGDLELYVLGMLSDEEAYKISQLAILFEEVDAEITRLRETLCQLSNEAELEPGPHVRENVISAIRQLKAEESVPSSSDALSAIEPTTNGAKIVSLGERKSNKQFLLAASVIALVVSIGVIIFLFNKNDGYEQQLASLENRLQSVDKSNQQQQLLLSNYTHAFEVLKDPATRKIDLLAVPNKPNALVHIYWNSKTTEVMLSAESLPPVPKGKQYQLWAIVDGKPVDAGMLSTGTRSMQKMKQFDHAEAFAITMEKEGGSPTPTMDAMYVMGKV